MDYELFGKICIGLFILSIVIWSALNHAIVNKDNIWRSLLISIPTTLFLNEITVGNTLWRTIAGDQKTVRIEAIPTVLFAPINIFGDTGFSRIPLWTPGYWTSNMFVIWWATFLMLTYLRK